MIAELKSQNEQLEKSKGLLDESRNTLGGLLVQTQQQAQLSQNMIQSLGGQLKLSQAQARLSARQVAITTREVETLQREFGKKPNILLSLHCKESLAPGDRFGTPRVFAYSPNGPSPGTSTFKMNFYKNSDPIPCSISIANDGDTDAEVLSIEVRLDRPHGLLDGFSPERYAEPDEKIRWFNELGVTVLGQHSSEFDGTVAAPYQKELNQVRFGNGPQEISCDIAFGWSVDSFALKIFVKGENFQQQELAVSFLIERPDEPSRSHK